MSNDDAGKRSDSAETVRIGGRTYRVRTQVVVEEVDCEEAGGTHEVRQRADGSFEMMLSETDAISIDKSEQAILRTCWPAMRNALSQHLNALSKKKADSAAEREGGQVVEDPTPFRVDGEIGRITFSCHQVTREGSMVLDTSREVFPALIGKEWYRTVGFKELAIVHGSLNGSYRHTTQLLNRIRHQPEATPLRTLQDAVEAEGIAVSEALDQEAQRILREDGFDDKTLTPTGERTASEPLHLAPDVVDAALRQVAPDEQTLSAMQKNPVKYEDPSVAVNVSIDDVLAKKQKEHRERPLRVVAEPPNSPAPNERRTRESQPEVIEDEKKRVHTTIAHVETQDGKRVFASAGVLSTCLLVVAFLVANKQLRSTWIFFADGQRSLQDLLLRIFAWQGTMQLILDWYHVVKKCKEKLSLALNNRHARNEAVRCILRPLWYGDVDMAIASLRQIDAKYVKASEAIEGLVGYLERNRPYIPCYAVRRKLGLCNSSNRVEKANDVIVAARQKHNGMSWSQPGSSALASLQALVCNDNHGQWFEKHTVDFRLAA